MDAKTYLKQNERLEELCESIMGKISNLRAKSTAIKSTMGGGERVQSSMKVSDKAAEIICNIIVLEEQLEKEVEDLIKTKKEITDKINAMHSNEYKLILNLRHLNLLTFERIAEEMNISVRWAIELHNRALREFDKKHFGGK